MLVIKRRRCRRREQVHLSDLPDPIHHFERRHPIDLNYLLWSDSLLVKTRENEIFLSVIHSGTNQIHRRTMNRISRCNFEYPKNRDGHVSIERYEDLVRRLTKGNEAILNGQIDLNIAGGTNRMLPFACTTIFVLIVPSKLSSALL
jgi:hypothetical protein